MPEIAVHCRLAWLPEAAVTSALSAAELGLSRCFAGWLARFQPAASGAITLRLALWLGPRWRGEIALADHAPFRCEDDCRAAHHLLYRLLESAAGALGAAVPSPLIAAFDDLATASPFALLGYFEAEGSPFATRRAALVRALDLDPGFLAPRLALAEDRLAAGEAPAAASLLAQRRVADPDRARELGLALWTGGEISAAIALLGDAVTANRDDGLAHAALAALLAGRGELQEAFLLASRATTLIADDYRSWSSLAEVHRAAGDHRQAAFFYQAALRLAPDARHVLKDAAASRLAAGRPGEALALIQRALAVAPDDPENHANLALAYHALGEPAAARTALRRAHQLAPDDPRFPALAAQLDIGIARH